MLESGSSGSVRGVLSNEHPYREPGSKAPFWLRSALPVCTANRTYSVSVATSQKDQKPTSQNPSQDRSAA